MFSLSLSLFLRAGSSIPSLWLLWYTLGRAPTGPWASWAIHGRDDLWPSTGVPESSITTLPAGYDVQLGASSCWCIWLYSAVLMHPFLFRFNEPDEHGFFPAAGVVQAVQMCSAKKKERRKFITRFGSPLVVCNVNSRALPNSFQHLVLLTRATA